MKQWVLITGGAIVITAVFSMWVYLLFFGTPQNIDDVFSDFGLGQQAPTERTLSDPLQTEVTQTVAFEERRLSQITTRPVAGFAFLENATSTTALRYAERGTGHVYEIDFTTGVETRILNKTFAEVTDAIFAPDGELVALITEEQGGTTVHLEATTDDTDTFSIPTNATDLIFTGNRELHYTQPTPDGMEGYRHNLITNKRVRLFSIPFQDARILWDGNETYVYNTPSPYLKSALYRIGENNTLVRIHESAYGFSALTNPFASGFVSVHYDLNKKAMAASFTANGERLRLAIPLILEKCTFDPTDVATLWCAAPITSIERTTHARWYRGEFVSDDVLWQVSLTHDLATHVLDFNVDSGRNVDVGEMAINQSGVYLIIRNRIDDTLWLYRIELLEPEEEIGE